MEPELVKGLMEKFSKLWGRIERHFASLNPLTEVETTRKPNSVGYRFIFARVNDRPDSGWSVFFIDPNGNKRTPVCDVASMEVRLEAIKAIKGLTDQIKSKNEQVISQLQSAVGDLEEYLKNPDSI